MAIVTTVTRAEVTILDRYCPNSDSLEFSLDGEMVWVSSKEEESRTLIAINAEDLVAAVKALGLA